ncbi:MAG: hypothetical protein OXR84_15265 [Magnetovibrio sp.]|nr:hypothetical protein [Magnetovibrio sp.]
MRLIMGLNAAGVVIAACYGGYVLAPNYVPLWGGLALIVYLAGLFQPVFAEHLAVSAGFRDLEGGYLEARRRERGMGPSVEILTDDEPPGSFRGPGGRGRVALLLCLIGTGLLILDAAQWWAARPPEPAKPGIISNF